MAYTSVTDEFQQSRGGVSAGEAMRWLMLPPLIHTSAMMPTFTALLTGNTVIMEPEFDAARVWQVADHRPQVMGITGDAMGRPLVEAFRDQDRDTSSLGVVASGAALFSAAVKEAFFEAMPNLMISDSVGCTPTSTTRS
ncbi:AMP-binding protein [Prescottella agglutinans]|uniref:AMP-binding protein n=1 Tax=Prescottella agglutinans TaxID=1644129 RepID=UPI003D968866